MSCFINILYSKLQFAFDKKKSLIFCLPCLLLWAICISVPSCGIVCR